MNLAWLCTSALWRQVQENLKMCVQVMDFKLKPELQPELNHTEKLQFRTTGNWNKNNKTKWKPPVRSSLRWGTIFVINIWNLKFIAKESKNLKVSNKIVRDPANNWWLYSINTSNEEVQIKRKNAKYFPYMRNNQPRMRFRSPPWNGYHSEIRYAGIGWPIHCSKNVNYLSHYKNQYEGPKRGKK